jgi:hypothetical protein
VLNAGNVVVVPSTTTTPLGASEADTVPLVKPGPPGNRVVVPITIPDASPEIVSSGSTLICTPASADVVDESLVIEGLVVEGLVVDEARVVELPSTTTTPPGASEIVTVPLVNPAPPGDKVEVPTTIPEASPVMVHSGLRVICTPCCVVEGKVPEVAADVVTPGPFCELVGAVVVAFPEVG